MNSVEVSRLAGTLAALRTVATGERLTGIEHTAPAYRDAYHAVLSLDHGLRIHADRVRFATSADTRCLTCGEKPFITGPWNDVCRADESHTHAGGVKPRMTAAHIGDMNQYGAD